MQIIEKKGFRSSDQGVNQSDNMWRVVLHLPKKEFGELEKLVSGKRVESGPELKLQQKVNIVELKRSGIIKEISTSETGQKYYVRYFDNGEAQYCYFYRNEIE